MHPVAFDGCFGWFHQPPAQHRGDTVALLCQGISQDASTGYRSYRQLADRLAETGYPTLRFDYPGTGDSCDAETAEDDTEHWAVWQNSIHHALDWLQFTTGARRVVLFGLRIGATLAAVVAERRKDIAGLVLLAPVLRGKTYMTQLAIEARLHNKTPHGTGTPGGNAMGAPGGNATGAPGGAEPPGRIVLGELDLSAETQQIIRQVDLSRLRIPTDCRVAVYTETQTVVLSNCVQAWQSRDVDVTCHAFAGLEALLRPTHQTDEPAADFSGVMAWLHRSVPPRPARLSALPAPRYPALRPAGCVETALRFGNGDTLSGILCRPAAASAEGLAIVIANSGGNPHHGFARLSVDLARHFARAGVASLRIDFAGLGDSRHAAHDDSPTQVFDVDRTGDMRAALDRLAALGYRRFAAHGLCSGAYHALHAGLVEPRFATLLLINLPWFTLQYDAAGPASAARRSLQALAQNRTRTQFLFSGGDPGLKQFERHFGSRGAALQGSPLASVEVASGWDHELTGRAMRTDAADTMLRFLLETTPDR